MVTVQCMYVLAVLCGKLAIKAHELCKCLNGVQDEFLVVYFHLEFLYALSS